MKKTKSAWGAPHAPTGTRWGTKVLAFFLSMTMCLSLLPSTALAAGTGSASGGEHSHTDHDGWIAIGGTNGKDLGGKISAAQTTGTDSSVKFYLTEDLSYPEDFTLKGLVYSGKTVTLCLNGHTLTMNGSSVNKAPLFEIEDGGTLNICDCKDSGIMQGGLGQGDPRGYTACYSLIKINDGGTLNLYSGKLYGENGMWWRVGNTANEVHFEYPIVDLADNAVFNMYGGTVEHWQDTGNNGFEIDSPAIGTGSAGQVNLYGGTVVGNINTPAVVQGKEFKNQVYIKGRLMSDAIGTIENAIFEANNPITSLHRMLNVQIIGYGAISASGYTGEALLQYCNMPNIYISGESDKGNNNCYLRVFDSTIGGAEYLKSIEVQNSVVGASAQYTIDNVSTVKITNSTVNASSGGTGITNADKITIVDSPVSGTVQTKDTTGAITIGGKSTVSDLYLRNDQKFTIDPALTDGAKITVRRDNEGDIIANPESAGNLTGKITANSGDLNFGEDGQVSLVPSETHKGEKYTALLASSSLSGTGKYYLTANWNGNITIPNGANITLCLHSRDLKGNITVEEGATLNLENESQPKDPNSTITGKIVNHGTLNLRNSADNNQLWSVTVNSGSETTLENTGTVTFAVGQFSTYAHQRGELKNNGTAPTIKNSGTLNGGGVAVTNSGAGPALENTDGTAEFAEKLTSTGNSAVVKVSGGEVKVDFSGSLLSGANGADSAGAIVTGGTLNMAFGSTLTATNAESAARVEPGGTLNAETTKFSAKTYALLNNGGTIHVNSLDQGLVQNNSGSMTLGGSVREGKAVVKSGKVTVSGLGNDSAVDYDIITLDDGEVIVTGATPKTTSGHYSIRVNNADAKLTLQGNANLSEAPVYLCKGSKLALAKSDSNTPRFKVAMEEPGVFAENVADSSFVSTAASANASYVVKYDGTAKTMTLTAATDHTHNGKKYTAITDDKTELTAGYYYLPQSVTVSQDVKVTGNVTICLNGNTYSAKLKPQEGATLTIEDESTGGGTLSGSITLAPTANFVLNSGTLTGSGPIIQIDNGETHTNQITINGGAIKVKKYWAIYNVAAGATVTVNGGTLTGDSDYYAIVMNGGTLDIKGGAWNDRAVGRTGNSATTGTITVSGGTFSGDWLFDLHGGTANVTGGTFAADYGALFSCSDGAKLTLDGNATFSSVSKDYTVTGVLVNDGSNVTVNKASFAGVNYGKPATFLNIKEGGTAIVEDATLTEYCNIKNAGTLTIKKLTHTGRGYRAPFLENTGGTATFGENVQIDSVGNIASVSGGTVTLTGGSYSGNSDLFEVSGGILNVNDSTLTITETNTSYQNYRKDFFNVLNGTANVGNVTLIAGAGTKYPYVGEGTGGTLNLNGKITSSVTEEGAKLRMRLTAPANCNLVLGENFNTDVKIPFDFFGVSTTFANSAWTEAQQAFFVMPTGYTWVIGNDSTGIRKAVDAEHHHKDGTQFYNELTQKDFGDGTNKVDVKLPADNAYLTGENTTITWNNYRRGLVLNGGERALCLNGHDLNLNASLCTSDYAGQKLTITNCADHQSTINDSIDLRHPTDTTSWLKTNQTDRLVLENVKVCGDINMESAAYKGDDYTANLINVTVTGGRYTVTLGAGKYRIENSTISTSTEYDDSVYMLNAETSLELVGTVNITGGYGLRGAGTVDASQLSSDSKIVLGSGSLTVTHVTPERLGCFSLSSGCTKSSRINYDAQAQTIKVEDAPMVDHLGNKITLTIISNPVAEDGTVTMTANFSSTDPDYVVRSYQWYILDSNSKKVPIAKAYGKTYTTDVLEPGSHQFGVLAYYSTGINKPDVYTKDVSDTKWIPISTKVKIDTSGITINGVTDSTKTYDGNAVSYSGTATGTYGSGSTYSKEFTYDWYQKAADEDGRDTKLTAAPKDVGSYYLNISTNDYYYSGHIAIPFTIAPATITVTPDSNQSKVYGAADPTLTYTTSGVAVNETAAFTGALSRETGGNVGTYAITMGDLKLKDNGTFKASNYTLALSETAVNFTINKKSLEDQTITVENIADETYTGEQIMPGVTVKDGTKELTSADYTVSYTDNTNAGTATVTITGQGNYSGEITKEFTITAKALDDSMISAIGAQTYTGEALTPNVTLTYNGKTLVKGTDYNVSYTDNTNVGTAKVTITAVENGNYSGGATATFTIGQKAITADMVTISGTYTYNGNAITPTIEVKDGNTVLQANTDYEVELSNNTNAGTATVKITGRGNYSGTPEKTFLINAKSLTSEGITVEGIENKMYTGDAITQTLTVKDGEKLLTVGENQDYTVSYESNTNAGTAKVEITGKGNYKDEITREFAIAPKALEDSMVSAIPAQTYTGNALTPDVTVKYGSITLTNDDYTVSYEDNTNAGSATVTITAKENGNYSGTAAATFTILQKTVDDPKITLSGEMTYTGEQITPNVAVDGLTQNTDYTVDYGENINAGEGTVTIKPVADSNYTFTEKTVKFTIAKKALTITGVEAVSRPYAPNNKSVDLTGGTLVGVVEADKDKVTFTLGSGTLDSADAGHKSVSTAIDLTGDKAGNYTLTQPTVTVEITKAEPTHIAPTGVKATYGQKLSEITLNNPDSNTAGTWAWADDTQSVGNAGENTFKAIFTPADEQNYQTVSDIDVVVTVAQADQPLAKTDMKATYGDTFEVTPITGAQGEVTYTVKSGSELLLTKGEDGKFTAKSGTGTAYITATADATDNYKQASIDIPVTLSKAVLTAKADNKSMYVNGTVPTDLTVSYTGFVNGDTKETVVEKAATASIAADVDGKKTGTFDITTNTDTNLKSGMNDNYTITVQNGTLTVSQRSSGGGGGSVSQTTYPITTPSKTDNGTVSVGSENAKQGDTVTITVTPDKGYTLETVTVTDKNGKTISVTKKSDTQYTFVMPNGKVEVKATFMEDNTMLNFFVDVHANDYYYDAVLWAAQKGVTAGTDATHFSPNASCTRAQIVTFLWRAAGSPEPKGTSSFTDVSADSYYAKAVAWAVENGITGGTGNGKFSPDGTCTREQAVTFLYRAAGSPDVSGGSAFSDVAGNAYYADAVAWAEKNGVTGGIGGGLFGSGNDCTRGQIVTFLYRTIQGK